MYPSLTSSTDHARHLAEIAPVAKCKSATCAAAIMRHADGRDFATIAEGVGPIAGQFGQLEGGLNRSSIGKDWFMMIASGRALGGVIGNQFAARLFFQLRSFSP